MYNQYKDSLAINIVFILELVWVIHGVFTNKFIFFFCIIAQMLYYTIKMIKRKEITDINFIVSLIFRIIVTILILL